MEFDYGRLREAIRRKGMSEGVFARRMGLSRASLSLRFNHHLYFSQRDMASALRILGIPPSEAGLYFFQRKKETWREFW